MREFIALDGESIKHHYILLANNKGDYIESYTYLKTDNILQWLCMLDQKYDAIFTGFGLNYDVEHWVRDLPDKNKDELFYQNKTKYKQYELVYYKKKFFQVRYPHKSKNYIFRVYDVIGFFTGNFESVVKSTLNVTDKIISEGKSKRSVFRVSELDEIKQYNKRECELLVEVMNELRNRFNAIGIYPEHWYGSSAIAQQVLRQWEVTREIVNFNPDYLKPELEQVFRYAYFGGRIELLKLGSFNNIRVYDINSAYPSAITIAPSCGYRWYKTAYHPVNSILSVYKVKWDIPERFCYIPPFPVRSDTGSISYPLRGCGYYWKPEIDAALSKYKKYLTIEYGYQQTEEKPTELAENVRKLYQDRQRYKLENNPAEFSIKIILNAMYGKFAQGVGNCIFQNYAYAGFITSYTRAKLLEAAYSGNQKDIIGFATDSIISTADLKLPISKQLGDWSKEIYDKGTFIMPGLYYLSGRKTKLATRGYGRIDNINEVIKSLSIRRKAETTVNIFVGYKLAKKQYKALGTKYLQIIQHKKEIQPYSLKKRHYEKRRIDWSHGVIHSRPLTGDGRMSAIYSRKNTIEEI